MQTIHRKKMTMEERIERFNSLKDCLPMRGTINLKNPEVLVVIIENYKTPVDNSKKTKADLIGVAVTRFICNGQRDLVNT